MTTVSVSNFNGLIPRLGSAVLPDNNAQIALNTRLQSGELRAWREKVLEYTPKQEGVQTIFKLEGPSGGGDWAEWTVETDVAYSPLADLDEHRIYYSEGGVCKKTNWTMAHDGDKDAPLPRNWLYMGVPRPEVGPTLTPILDEDDQSQENIEDRAYVWIWVSTFGNVKEESCPSDATLVECSIVGGTVMVSGFPTAPTDHYNITGLRLYRSVAGEEEIVYMMVDEFDVVDGEVVTTGKSLNGVEFEDGQYPDTRETADLGITLESMYYEEPPEGLTGLVNMPNGMIAGFVGNQVWFCEPYIPSAFPSTYMLTVDSQIVGLGVYGNTLVVCTERNPYTMYGTHPSEITQEKLPMNQACVNKRSIAYDQFGVLYASSNGLVIIAGGQMDVFTRDLFTREDWQEYNPSLMVGMMYNNNYICSYAIDDYRKTLVFARNDTPTLVELDFDPTCLFVERITGDVYGLSHEDGLVYKIDASPVNYLDYTWKSKLYMYPRSLSFSCSKLDGDYSQAEAAKKLNDEREKAIEYNKAQIDKYDGQCLQGCLNDVMVNVWTVDGGVLWDVPDFVYPRVAKITYYADGEVIYQREVDTNVAFRLPRANAYHWEVQIEGSIPIRAFMMSTSMAELQG